MSRRTAESNKAILTAWNKEKELVQEVKGTREWTSQQQKDILDKGKAYDENGIAFQGQHMKSVEKYPEYQGDPGNIQFLTRAEHLEAHDGDWRNPTNWHFNPVTKEKTDFGDGEFIQCEIIQLADPVNKTQIKPEIEKEVNVESVSSVSEGQKKAESNKKYESLHETVPPNNIEDITKQGFVPKLKSGLKTISKTIIEFPDKHPNAMKAIKGVGLFVATVAVATVKESSRSGSSNSEYGWSDDDRAEYENSYEDYPADQDTSESSERSSPDEHIVRGHGQRYHYKDGSVKWKDKDPYPRGGNIEE
jgi:hypothetical protein